MGERTNLRRTAILLLAGAGATAWISQFLDPYPQSVVLFTLINVILAVSLGLTNGLCGLFSLGHPGFMALGGYTSAILAMPAARKVVMLPDLPTWLAGQAWPFPAALVAGGLVAALAALVLGPPVLRLRGHYLAVATLGLLVIVQSLVTNLDSLTRGALGLSGLTPWTGPWMVFAWLVFTLAVAWRLKHSSFGRSLQAIRDDELAARSLGVRVALSRLATFVIGAFFAGVAGGLWVHLVTIVTPNSFGVTMAFMLIVVLVLGGQGSITGAAVAAIGLGAASEFLRPVEEALRLFGLSQMLAALGVLVVLIWRPQGLFGTGEWSWLRRQTDQHERRASREVSMQPNRLLMAVAATLALSVGTATAADPVRLVALYNLTGGMSSIDQPSLNGAELRAAMVNEAGGVLGGRSLEIVTIDTKTDQREAATAAKRAVDMEGVVAGMGFNDTTFVLAAGPLFEAAGIPFVTPGATAPELPDMVGANLFLVPFGDNVQAHAMADYALETIEINSVAVWTDNGMDYAKGLSRYFQERFTAKGGKVALDDRFLTGDKDFSAQVARLQAREAELGAVFVAAGPDEAGAIVRQIREAGVLLPILGGDGFDTPLVVEVPGADLADNVYFTTHAYSDLGGEVIDTFKAGYEKRYGRAPENAFAALGYDAVGMLAAALERAGSDDPTALREALAATKGYQGVTGTISYEGVSRVPLKTVAVMAVRKGQVKLETAIVPQG